jgi:hypothetical protein
MPAAFMEFGYQKLAAGFEYPVHLTDSSLLIIFRHMVQYEGARESIEGCVSERKVLRKGNLKVDRQAATTCPDSGAVDHLGAWVDAIHRARRDPLREGHRKPSGAAPHIEYPIAGSKLEIVGEHSA